jgi:hypothetical protein
MEDLTGKLLAAFLAGKEVRFSIDNSERGRVVIENNTESCFEVLGIGRNCFFGIQRGFMHERVALVEVV